MENPLPAYDLVRFGNKVVRFTGAIAIDLLLGITFGWITNAFVMILRKKLGLSMQACFVIQLAIIVIILYYLSESTFLSSLSAWHGPYSYGIVFITTFVGSQSNVVRWFGAISQAETEMVNTWTAAPGCECVRQ